MAPAETIEPTAQPLEAPPPPSNPDRPLHTLPPPFTDSRLEVLTQGAEALVYKTVFLTPHTPCVVKYRPPKPYRHPILDRRLTKARLLAEARVLVRCKRDGVCVPGVLGADWEAGWLVLEWVEGRTVRKVLDAWAERVVHGQKENHGEGEGNMEGEDEAMLHLMRRVGKAVGKLHDIGVCHGDLTTSNLMLKTPQRKQDDAPRSRGRLTTSEMRMMAEDGVFPEFPSVSRHGVPGGDGDSLEGEITLIDFGLASHSTQNLQDEDRAVDLYVLERAFAATHPAAEPLFKEVLNAYGESFKGAKAVLKRLEDVRLRGRKRSMLG